MINLNNTSNNNISGKEMRTLVSLGFIQSDIRRIEGGLGTTLLREIIWNSEHAEECSIDGNSYGRSYHINQLIDIKKELFSWLETHPEQRTFDSNVQYIRNGADIIDLPFQKQVEVTAVEDIFIESSQGAETSQSLALKKGRTATFELRSRGDMYTSSRVKVVHKKE